MTENLEAPFARLAKPDEHGASLVVAQLCMDRGLMGPLQLRAAPRSTARGRLWPGNLMVNSSAYRRAFGS